MTGALQATCGGGGARVALDDVNVSDSNIGSAAIAYYALEADGDIVTAVLAGSTDAGDWVTPKSAAGANYECRATLNSGALSGGTTGSWLALSSDRAWNCSQAGTGTTSASLTIEIRLASTGTVLDSCTVTLTATA